MHGRLAHCTSMRQQCREWSARQQSISDKPTGEAHLVAGKAEDHEAFVLVPLVQLCEFLHGK